MVTVSCLYLMQHILELMSEVTPFYPSRMSTEQRQTFETSQEWYLEDKRTVVNNLIAGRFTELIPNNVKINYVPSSHGVH